MLEMALGVLIILAGYSYYKTKSKELLYTHLTGWVTTHILFMFYIFVTNQFTQIEPTTLNQVLYIATLLASTLNLAGLTDAYITEFSAKKFDMDHITRAHFDQTLKQSILLILLVAGSIPLLSRGTVWTLSLFGVAAISALVANHLAARRILVDKG